MTSNLTVTVTEASDGILGIIAGALLAAGFITLLASLWFGDIRERSARRNGTEERQGLPIAVGVVGIALIIASPVLGLIQWHTNNAYEGDRLEALQAAAEEQLGAGFLNLDYNNVGSAFANSPTLGTAWLQDGALVGDHQYGACQMVTVDEEDNTFRFLVSCRDGDRPLQALKNVGVVD